MRFSIVTVALNPGDKLQKTLDSVFCQTCTDYEIILKDGGSTDGSMDKWRNAEQKADNEPGTGRVRFFDVPDKGIYDAMNQAVQQAEGDFVLFLNCGDMLADRNVLERVAEILSVPEREQRLPRRRRLQDLPVTATFPAINPVFTARICAGRSPMICGIRFGRIMTISSGAVTEGERSFCT